MAKYEEIAGSGRIRVTSDRSVSRIKTEERSNPSTLKEPSQDLRIALGVNETFSTVAVNETTALRMISVYAAVRVLAEGVGSLPMHVYEKQNNSRVRITDDPRAWLLDDSPNPEQTAMELWEGVMGHLNLWGNAYIYREINPATGFVSALWPLRPDQTAPHRRFNDNALFYVTQLYNGEQRVLLPDEVIHIKAFGTTGDVGISPVGVSRQALGTAMAAEEYAGRFFANDARPGGMIEFDKPLTDDQIQKVINQWKATHQGLTRSHLTGILTNGATWRDVGMPMADAQFLETRQFGVREVARLFRVPPFLIADLEGSSQYKSIEEQSLNFLQFSLRPWLTRIEQQIKRNVFGSQMDRSRGLYPEFKADALLRGSTKERYEAYRSAINSGWMSRAEIRELENLPFVEGLDTYGTPSAHTPEVVDATGNVVAKKQEEDEDEDKPRSR
jgi:HK97 family phage portal protein